MIRVIDAVIIADENGLPLYSKILNENKVDVTLLLAFFSALKSFAVSFIDVESGIKWIHIGEALLDFEIAEFENIGQVDVLMISRGINPRSSHALLNEITEKFTIYWDEMAVDHPDYRNGMKVGVFPDFSGFDPQLNDILGAVNTEEEIEFDLHVTLPASTQKLIQKLFLKHPELQKMYEGSESLMLEQMLADYAKKYLETDIKIRFLDK